MSANIRSLSLIMVLLVLLAGCGGGGGDDDTPEVTAEPTLTFDERASFTPGTAENPLRLVVRPVHRVFSEVQTILAELSDIPAEGITRETTLRDELGLADNLNALTAPLNTSFSISLTADENLALETVADLTHAIERRLSQQMAQTLFERTSIYFDVVPVTSFGEGLNAVCNSNQGVVSMAWLDGVTTLAATAGDCGDASLRVATLGDVYDVGLLQDIALEAEVEATSAVELTAEATPDELEIVDVTETPTSTPTAEPTPLPTEEAEIEATAEATEVADSDLLDDTLRLGTPVLTLFNRDLGTTSFDVIRGRTFCRVGYDDFYSWVVPTMVMRRNGIDPQSDLEVIHDYENEAQLVRAVAAGRCTAAMISEDTYTVLLDVLPQSVWADIRFGEMTPVFPYPTLVYPADIQQGVRLTLNAVFEELTTDDTGGTAFRWLLGQEVLAAVQDNDLATFTAYLQSTGLDFAQLGD